MSTELLEELQIYGEDFDAGLTPVTLDDLENVLLKPVGSGAVRPLQHRQSRRGPLRGSAYALATAFVVLLLVGGAALLLRVTSLDAPVATTPAAESLLEWTRVPHDDTVLGGVGDQVMSDVTAGGRGLVAVGWDGSGDHRDAAVWTSLDGERWSRVPSDDKVFGGAEISSVTAGGPGLVAVGGTGSDAVVWTSVDGVTWSRVPVSDALLAGPSHGVMSDVTAGGPGLVAVGRADSDAAVWTSPDGLTWSRVLHDEATFGGADNQVMLSVTAGGPGLVAVGLDGHGPSYDDRGQAAAVWTSPDGITWSRVPHDDTVFGERGEQSWQRMNGVTVGGPGLVAVGSVGPFNVNLGLAAAVWISPDGITWSRVPHEEAVFDAIGTTMRSVTAGGPGLVAVGSQRADIYQAAVVWTSPDGITWSRVHHDASVFGGEGEQLMMSVTAAGSGLVAVGSDTGGLLDTDAAVWQN